jgi:hypothetical protein
MQVLWDGSHRLYAAKRLGITDVPVSIISGDYVAANTVHSFPSGGRHVVNHEVKCSCELESVTVYTELQGYGWVIVHRPRSEARKDEDQP